MLFKLFVIVNLIYIKNISTLPVEDVKSETKATTLSPGSTIIVNKDVPSTVSTTPTTTTEFIEITKEPEPPVTPRAVISFDQRQEGKYNIRADLENFVILVVPSSPSSGLNLLDLLTRSALKKSAHAKHAHHKKSHHEIKSTKVVDEVKSSETVVDKKNYEIPPVDQFVEGRTPYRVDISSIDTGINSNIEAAHSLEIMQPPYQITNFGRSNSYKPIIFELESEGVQQTPSKVSVTVFNRDEIKDGSEDVVHVGVGVGKQKNNRKTKSLTDFYGTDEFNNNFNTVLLTTSDINNDDDIDSGLNLSNSNSFDDSFDSLNIGNLDAVGVDPFNKQHFPVFELQQQNEPHPFSQDHYQETLKLIGATEQCGPGGRRDSYGICRFHNLD